MAWGAVKSGRSAFPVEQEENGDQVTLARVCGVGHVSIPSETLAEDAIVCVTDATRDMDRKA